MTEKLLVPDIGDFENVEVIELLVKFHLIANSNTFCPIFRHSLSTCFKND